MFWGGVVTGAIGGVFTGGTGEMVGSIAGGVAGATIGAIAGTPVMGIVGGIAGGILGGWVGSFFDPVNEPSIEQILMEKGTFFENERFLAEIDELLNDPIWDYLKAKEASNSCS